MDEQGRITSPPAPPLAEAASESGTPSPAPFTFNNEISVPHVAAALLGLSYVAGYLIHSFYVKSLGIRAQSFLKSEYVEAGIVFMILSAAVLVLPSGIVVLLKRIRDEHAVLTSGYNEQSLALTLPIALNYFYVLVLFSAFVTTADWDVPVHLATTDVPLSDFFYIFSALTVASLISLSVFRIAYVQAKRDVAARHALTDRLVERAVNAVKCILIAGVVVFDVILLVSVPWVREVAWHSRYWLLVVGLLSGSTAFAGYRFRTLASPESRRLLFGLSSIAMAILCYLSAIAYADGVYPILPFNRGGRYPHVQTTLAVSDEVAREKPDILQPGGSGHRTIPLFVVEQTEEFLYVSRPYPIFAKPPSGVYAIRLTDVVLMQSTPHTFRYLTP